MSASALDKFKKVAPNTGWQVGSGGVADAVVTTIPLNVATGLPDGTGVKLTIERIDSSGNKTPSKMERIDGVISGNNVIDCVRGVEGTAQAHASGAVVEILISADLWNDVMDGILAEHNQDGSHASTLLDPKTNTVASSATPEIDVDTTDIFTITALAVAITSMTSGLSGTPVNGQKLIIRIKDNGTARAIAWGASFASRGASLPTTTVVGKYLYVGLIYNSTASVWDCVAVAQEV